MSFTSQLFFSSVCTRGTVMPPSTLGFVWSPLNCNHYYCCISSRITNHESRILMSNFRKSTATSLPIVSSSWRLLNSRPYLSFLPVMYLLLLPIVQYDMLLNYASFYSIPTQTSMCCSRFTTSLP